VFFGAFTGAELLRRDPPDRYVFDDRASYAEETEATVNYLVKVLRLKPDQIAVFAQQDGYGDSGYAGVVKAVRALKRRSRLPLADRLLRLRAILITNTPLRITPAAPSDARPAKRQGPYISRQLTLITVDSNGRYWPISIRPARNLSRRKLPSPANRARRIEDDRRRHGPPLPTAPSAQADDALLE
jgi:hypothetical protein